MIKNRSSGTVLSPVANATASGTAQKIRDKLSICGRALLRLVAHCITQVATQIRIIRVSLNNSATVVASSGRLKAPRTCWFIYHLLPSVGLRILFSKGELLKSVER